MNKTSVGQDARLMASEHVQYRRFDDDLIMVDLKGGEYFALDAVGARMWELLTSGMTPGEVALMLAVEYTATEVEILRDCTTLASELLARGLMVLKTP